MKNLKLIERVHEKLASVVQGGADPDKERALTLLTERYAARINAPNLGETPRWLDCMQWILAGEGPPPFEILLDIQRDYLNTLAPSARSEIDAVGIILTTDLWVEVAAANLAPEAKERISKEIKAHYEDALEEASSTESNDLLTHFEALNRLGDPRKAAKIFRKTYLTAREHSRLSNIIGPFKRTKRDNLSAILMILVIALLTYQSLLSKETLLLSCVGSFYLFGIVLTRLVPPLVRTNRVRRAYGWIMASAIPVPVAFGAWLADFINFSNVFVYSLVGMVALVFYAHQAYWYSFLLRKRLPAPEQE